MNKLTNTAKKLDTLFKILHIFSTIAAVACLVSLGIIAVGLIFDLDPNSLATGYEMIEIGFVELQIAPGYAASHVTVLTYTAIMLVLAFICMILYRMVFTNIRAILSPMIQAEPFSAVIALHLKKLARLAVFLGLAFNDMELTKQLFLVNSFDLPNLLLSEKISHVTVNFNFDLTFLVMAAILLLMSYVFRYGEELQALSDETL